MWKDDRIFRLVCALPWLLHFGELLLFYQMFIAQNFKQISRHKPNRPRSLTVLNVCATPGPGVVYAMVRLSRSCRVLHHECR